MGGDRTKSWNREPSPPNLSPDRSAPARDRSPVRSFHKTMMERSGQNGPPRGIENASKNGSGSWNQGRSRSRSRSPNRFNRAPAARERSPVLSFHKAMTDKENLGGSHDNQDKDSRNPPGDRMDDGGYEKSSRFSHPREEDEEGMIHQEEEVHAQGKGAADL